MKLTYVQRRNIPELGMIDDVERKLGHDGSEQHIGSWRVVVSAWVLVLVIMLLMTGAKAVACLRGGGAHHHQDQTFARAVIPRHDACGGPGIASAPGPDGCQNVPLSQDPSAAYW